MLILVFMVPLPGFFYNNLSSFLQLLSSEIGVDVIRLFRVPVHLSGNVIDLGVFKLQVAEACSGLRYLFPLVSLSFIAAYFYRAPFWKRAVVVLSSLPITVLMNSARIGVIGILVDYAGIAQAQGFLHYFEGWVVFMMCLAILLGEMVLLSKFGPDRTKAFHEIFRIDWPDAVSRTGNEVSRGIPTTLWISALLLLLGAAVGATLIGNRQEIIPPRTDFSQFPARIGAWTGRFDRMRQIYLTALKLSDYVMADYTRPNGGLVNFYVAYYKSQMAGGSVHSPRSCIPGGGWLIKKLDQKTIPGVVLNGRPLRVNRVLIRKGNNVQVVYYWFQERGRDLTNEYVVKWYLFWDALTRNRTDGALVRVTAFVPPGADPASTDQELVSFLRQVVPLLPKYLPN
jgi:exosortase D (VPLPA-CTERM-specific)